MESVKFVSIIWLLPIIFMFHDFEEIIFAEWWINKEREILLHKYPKIAREYNKFNTAGFAMAVAEEFIILVFIALTAVIFQWYYLWFGALLTFFVHLIIHLIQWIIYKKYIPAIVTVIPAIMYSVYAMLLMYKSGNMELLTLVIWGGVSIVIFSVNLLFAHKISKKFTRFIKNTKVFI